MNSLTGFFGSRKVFFGDFPRFFGFSSYNYIVLFRNFLFANTYSTKNNLGCLESFNNHYANGPNLLHCTVCHKPASANQIFCNQNSFLVWTVFDHLPAIDFFNVKKLLFLIDIFPITHLLAYLILSIWFLMRKALSVISINTLNHS